MNIITMLKEDHRKVKKLFKEFEAAKDSTDAKRLKLAEEIFHELEVHTKLEEDVFYPPFQDEAEEKKDEKGEDLVKEAYEEHHVAKMLIKELRKMSVHDEMYDAKMKVLQENVEHHIEEEEEELFPKAKKLLSEELEEISEEAEEHKQDLEARL